MAELNPRDPLEPITELHLRDPLKPITVAIDFGTSNSGYAYEYSSGELGKKVDVHVNDWQVAEDDTKSTSKTPTIVLLNPQKEFDSFGYEAELKYASLCSVKKNKTWYYFRRFKLLLYDTKNLDIGTKIKDETGKEMVAVEVFGIALRYLKDHVINRLMAAKENSERNYFEHNILWIITVPAIWSDAAKQFMRAAAAKADIENNDLRLVLEPEAAAVHCRYSLLRLPVEHGNESSFDTLPEGYRYIVVDMGGGTVDIATHQVATDGKVFELHSAVGNNIGGLHFNERFLSFLTDLYGPIFTEWKQTHSRQFLEIDRKIEGTKFKVSSSDSDVIFRIPLSLHDEVLEGRYESMLEFLSTTGNMNLASDFEKDELQLSNLFAKSFFKETIKGITSEIQEIVEEITDIKSIILVGGLGKSKYILDSIRNAFPQQKVIVPEDPGLSVLKGAVLLGNKPQLIDGRIARFSYGIDLHVKFEEGVHREDYKRDIDGIYRCYYRFEKLVEKGKILKYGEKFLVNANYTAKHTKRKSMLVTIDLYQSSSLNPMYVTDKGCLRLGVISATPPAGDWPDSSDFTLEIEVGEAEFKFNVQDVTNKRTFKTTVDFLFQKK